MFTSQQAANDAFIEKLERKIRTECSTWGTETKITNFASNPNGIVLVRFKEPTAATTAIENLNGRMTGDTKIGMVCQTTQSKIWIRRAIMKNRILRNSAIGWKVKKNFLTSYSCKSSPAKRWCSSRNTFGGKVCPTAGRINDSHESKRVDDE